LTEKSITLFVVRALARLCLPSIQAASYGEAAPKRAWIARAKAA
jgi:hypothetical protein